MRKYLFMPFVFFSFSSIAEARTSLFNEWNYNSFHQYEQDENMNLAILYCKAELGMKKPAVKVEIKKANDVSIICIEMGNEPTGNPIMPSLKQLIIESNR